jgi:hypothetical protein
MAWTSTKDKERFFEELDKAFNTPTTEILVLPQAQKRDAPKSSISTDVREPKKLKSNETRQEKRPRSTSATILQSMADAGISPPILDNPKPRRTSSSTRKSRTDPFQQRSDNGDQEDKKPGLLDGMVLFFIPNSKKHAVRKFRMTLFAQHGAIVRDSWNEDITHIICDKSITGERVLRDLRWEQFPVQFLLKVD